MFSNNRTILTDDDAISVGLHLHGPPHGTRGNGVSDVVKAHKAGLGYRSRAGMEAIEAASTCNQMRPFGFKHLPDRLIRDLRMLVGFGVSNTLVEQQAVQLFQALDPQDGCEEALANQADLVLHLAFLPTRCWRASRRFNEVVTAHLQKAAIIHPVFANKDGIHCCLHVVIDAARAGAPEESECFVVSVKHHLLSLAWISARIKHPAVAQADMGNLQDNRRVVNANDLMGSLHESALSVRHLGHWQNIDNLRPFAH